MSAVVGIYNRDGRPVDRETLDRMVSMLAHRGPDGKHVWQGASIGLGHLMLQTTPESIQERQPLPDPSGRWVITADARLDNRDELRRAFDLTDRQIRNMSDSQLILAAYDKWGTQCPAKLLGDFAFAIWDDREKMLFCARDHFGVRPFYYHMADNLFAFATEYKAIFCLPEVPCLINERSLVDQLLMPVFDDPTMTFYCHILRLAPAHCMIVREGSVQIQEYWSLDSSRDIRLDSDEEYAQAFRELFTQAVDCRLRSDSPIGSMLSGGLDSSSIACVAQRQLAKNGRLPLYTFSGIFDEVPKSNERQYSRAVIDQGGFEPYTIHADQMSALTAVDQRLWHEDEPDSANLYIGWEACRLANLEGVRVILDGYDGDTTLSHGTGYLIELASTGRWFALATELRGLIHILSGPPLQSVMGRYLRKYSPSIQRGQHLWRRLHRRQETPQPADTILNADFARRLQIEERRRHQPSEPQTEREHHCHLLRRPLLSSSLEQLNKAAGAFSIELRFPFFDRRLVEFCLALPPRQKLHRGWSRIVMRRAMAGILPSDVQWRRGKSNLQFGFDYGLLKFEQAYLDQWFLNESKVIEDYVDLTYLKNAYDRLRARNARPVDGHIIWKSVVLARWLQLDKYNRKGTVNAK